MKIRRLLLVTLVTIGFVTLTVGHDPSTLGLMTPLLPITAITGHSGLLTAGLTGAALLKLKAAAVIAYWLSNRKHKRSHKGHGWKVEVHKHKHVVHHRSSRSVEEKDAPKTPVAEKASSIDMSEFDPSLDEVLQYDQLGCGMRLVCDLSATPDESLKEDEKMILQLFGRDGGVRHGERASRGKLSYSYAALLGSHSRDNKVCSNVYGRCPYSGSEIMYSLRDVTV